MWVSPGIGWFFCFEVHKFPYVTEEKLGSECRFCSETCEDGGGLTVLRYRPCGSWHRFSFNVRVPDTLTESG